MDILSMLIFFALGGLVGCLIHVAISLNEMSEITKSMLKTLEEYQQRNS